MEKIVLSLEQLIAYIDATFDEPDKWMRFKDVISGRNRHATHLGVQADECACGNPKSPESPCCAECVLDKKEALAANA